jgi:hypothetical protein
MSIQSCYFQYYIYEQRYFKLSPEYFSLLGEAEEWAVISNVPSKPGMQVQQLGWLGQSGGSGEQRFSKKVHNRHSYYDTKLTKNTERSFDSPRETETRERECDSHCTAAHERSLEVTLVIRVSFLD